MGNTCGLSCEANINRSVTQIRAILAKNNNKTPAFVLGAIVGIASNNNDTKNAVALNRSEQTTCAVYIDGDNPAASPDESYS